ncbi:MAG: THUMP domain-containing protein [Actinomycetota bacterium]|nr:THUMP domain-containing protein [Actinomycetota bacterium]
MILLTLSPEIHLKSSRTRRRFLRLLSANLRAALAAQAPGARLRTQWDRLTIEGEDLATAARVAARIFGVQKAHTTRPVPWRSFQELGEGVAALARPQVSGKTFAVRVRRRGVHDWSSLDAERLIGSLLVQHSAGVDLDHPQVEIRVRVDQDCARWVEQVVEGPEGLPLGSQGRVMALLSGGFDSAVASWMLMRRGSPVDFVHFRLDCAQSEHAMAVAHHLHERWGHGSRPLLHLIDFQAVKDALQERVDPRLRQVVLKQLMLQAADRLAARSRSPALVTGESVGQVSSQTLEHLAAIDRWCSRTVLRPLSGLTKQEIIDWSRRVGTHDLSARAKEVCDLSDGPVAVAARHSELAQAHGRLPEALLSRALEERRVLTVEDWVPGDPLVAVVAQPPDGIPLIGLDRGPDGEVSLPPSGPVALGGRRAPWVASRLHRRGRQVWVVEGDLPPAPLDGEEEESRSAHVA